MVLGGSLREEGNGFFEVLQREVRRVLITSRVGRKDQSEVVPGLALHETPTSVTGYGTSTTSNLGECQYSFGWTVARFQQEIPFSPVGSCVAGSP